MIPTPIAAALFLVLSASLAGRAPAAPVWPLDLGTRYLTSNYMEQRPGRWHAGLDLKTRSRPGFPVRAAEDGWIRRVRTSPYGYGRAIYLSGESGKTYVYAHLERFADFLDESVRAEQAARGNYRVRLEFAAGEVPVRAGQVLGLSGQSGTLGPHLHFEVRDAQNRPLNPQQHGFAVEDSLPPLITAVTAHPAAGGAPVGGGDVAVAVTGPALADTLPALSLTGPVAFSAAISDRSDVRGHVLEPWLIEVSLDGDVVYRCRNEVFAFGQVNRQRLEWCAISDRDGAPLIREHWLHRRPGVDLAGREGELWFAGDGEGLAPGRHELVIAAEDLGGGRTEIVVPLVVGRAGLSTGWNVRPAEVRWGESRLTPFLELGPAVPDAWRRELDPARGDPVLAPTVMWMRPVPREDWPDGWTDPPGIVPDVPALEVEAADWPLDADVRLQWPAGAAADSLPRWAFVRDREGWDFAGAIGADGVCGVDAPGFYVACVDTTAPAFGPAPGLVVRGPVSEVEGVTLPRWETFAVTLLDGGTGVDAASLAVTLDGRTLVAEPDLLRDRVLITLPNWNQTAGHEVIITASDRAGNRAVTAFVVECR